MSSKYQLRKDPTRGDAPAGARDRSEMDWVKPVETAVSPAPPQGLGSVSRKLEDLLIREAHLKLGRAALAPALEEAEAMLKEVTAARPALLSF